MKDTWDYTHQPALDTFAKPTHRLSLRKQPLTPLHWLIGLLVLISIGRVHDHVPALAALRPGLLLTAACVAMAVVYRHVLRLGNVTRPPYARMVIAIGLVAIISSLTGISIGNSGSFLLTALLPVYILFLLTTASVRNTHDLRWLCLSFIAGMLAVAVASIFLADRLYLDGYTRQGGVGMYDGNDIAVIYAVGIPLTVALIRVKGSGSRLVSASALFLALFSLALSASRGGFIGLMVVSVAVLILSRGWTLVHKLVLISVPILTLTFFAPQGYWNQMATLLNPTADYNFTSESGRIAIWTRGMGYVAAYPVFGIGPDNFLRAEWMMSPATQSGLLGVPAVDRAPHNTFLQVWAELGTAGLGFWLLLLIYGVLGPLALRSRMPQSWLTGSNQDHRLLYLLSSYLPACYAGFAVTSFFVSHAYTSIVYLLTGMAAAHHVIVRRELRAYRLRQLGEVQARRMSPSLQSVVFPATDASIPPALAPPYLPSTRAWPPGAAGRLAKGSTSD